MWLSWKFVVTQLQPLWTLTSFKDCDVYTYSQSDKCQMMFWRTAEMLEASRAPLLSSPLAPTGPDVSITRQGPKSLSPKNDCKYYINDPKWYNIIKCGWACFAANLTPQAGSQGVWHPSGTPRHRKTSDISEPLRCYHTVSSSLCLLLITFFYWIHLEQRDIVSVTTMHRYNWPKPFKASIFLIMIELRKRKHATRHLSYTPSQEGSGWLQKWFFSQTSGSSWLSLYPGSHWKDTVEPMDRSLLDLAPLTGIPGSMQEYVSNVTTAGMSKYRELPEQVWSNQRNQSLLWCRTTLWKLYSGDLYRPVFSL